MFTEKYPSQVEPFFQKSETLSLGEKYIRPGLYGAFDIGQAMATLNATGYVDFDLHRDNWGVDVWGKVKIIDFGHVRPVKLSPLIAAESLVPLFMSFEPDEFHAILSGFVTYSTTFIESRYENFTRELLNILGGTIIDLPDIRHRALDLDNLKSGLSFTFCVNEQNRIEINTSITAVQLFNGWAKEPKEIFKIASYFVFSGIDISKLILPEDLARTLPSVPGELHSFLYRFFNHHVNASDVNRIIQLGYDQTIAILCVVLSELTINWGYPNPFETDRFPIPPNSQPDHMARGILWKAIKNFPAEFSRSLIDDLIDLDNFVANLLDKNAAENNSESLQHKSSEFAQSSYMLLQYSIYGNDWDEKQVIRIAQDLANLKWRKFEKDSTSSSKIYRALFLNTYGNAFTRLFNSFEAKETILWSYIWEVIESRRKAIEIVLDIITKPEISKSDEDFINQFFPTLANGLGQALFIHQKTVIDKKDTFNIKPWVHEKKPMEKEIIWAVETAKYAKDHPIVSSDGLKRALDFNRLHRDVWSF